MTVTAIPTADLRVPATRPEPAQPVPAPIETMLAVLARTASHAGPALSVTLTEPTHTVVVNVCDSSAFAAWRATLPTGGSLVRGDALGVLAEAEAHLYGWLMRVRVANP